MAAEATLKLLLLGEDRSAERRARDRVVLADEFAPEGFEGGAGCLGVGEFGREPGIKFGGLIGGDAEFFELRVEGGFTH